MEKNGSFLDILWAALLLPGLHAMSDRGPERGEGRRAGGGDCHLSEYEKSWQNGSDFINEYMP